MPANWDQEINAKKYEFNANHIVIGLMTILAIGLIVSVVIGVL